eukprot:CAMPEP_0203775386 /NCGR_PEP_ID=MMETSP0099_2-20121227/6048_1 /ASSEMBLY_ACC=CAM_ASM_000209 /TAXON_ID=96639 /ORGANISM=" , Strain NY0313808BC1" /LENGTH=434 /DNA_ID=CAMNT_0050674049 /DNA_START=105 /DNA_END=1410 /DNA_ORIENTATION=-
MEQVCIVGYSRTPIGSFGGTLSSVKATELGSITIKESLKRSGIQPDQVEHVFMGNVVSAGTGQHPARQAALGAGIPVDCPCTTLNKMCASGMKAVSLGYMSVATGDAQVVVAGGFESMSNIPFYSTTARFGHKFGDVSLVDGIQRDGLHDAYTDEEMGRAAVVSFTLLLRGLAVLLICTLLCAVENKITREEQDAYTLRSYNLAAANTREGSFLRDEIVPVIVKNKKNKKKTVVDSDEEAVRRPATKESLASLPPVFKLPAKVPESYHSSPEASSVTAANSSVISDGAASIVLASRKYALKHNLPILGVISSGADAANQPEYFTTAPAKAMKKALERANLKPSQVDLFEVNEAFAVVPLVTMKLLGIPLEKMNVRGGAISIGHPIGCSGARIIVTLLSALSASDKSVGCCGICNGGGGASAIVITRPRLSSSNL